MIIDELKIEIKAQENQVEVIFSYDFDPQTYHKHLNLSELEEFQGRLAIAAAKLRGKLAKEATQ
jgi:hypothetical protein